MPLKLGYLLPTRERIMQGHPEAEPLLALASRAADSGFDSIWVGDSLLARPRHEPLTLLAALAGRVPGLELGTAVLLPALRNPVLLAHQVATLDQISGGRLILGVGFASDRPNIRAEFTAAGVPFDKRVGRMMEALRLCRALWRGEAVTWEGRWTVTDGVLAPTPCRPGGPPLWIGGNLPASLARAGTWFDGWFPNAPDAPGYLRSWTVVRDNARAAGREPAALTGAMYLTVALDDESGRADAAMNTFLEGYYGTPAAATRQRQACYAGPAAGLAEWVAGYARAGASHIVLRFAGAHERHLGTLAGLRHALAG